MKAQTRSKIRALLFLQSRRQIYVGCLKQVLTALPPGKRPGTHCTQFCHNQLNERRKCHISHIKIVCVNCVSFVSGLCEVETGQSNIILDIEESRESRKSYFKALSVLSCSQGILRNYDVTNTCTGEEVKINFTLRPLYLLGLGSRYLLGRKLSDPSNKIWIRNQRENLCHSCLFNTGKKEIIITHTIRDWSPVILRIGAHFID
jgi:hypothetical protein